MQDKILMRMRNWLSGSGLAKGGRLPPERALCETLGISRTELRKALLVLEAEGVLARHIGRGTFLAKASGSKTSRNDIEKTIAELAKSTGPIDAMNARLALEPEIAQLAALHATPAQLSEMRRLVNAMRDAVSWSAYETLDSDFHEAIAAASGNSLLQVLHRMLNGVRLIVVWHRLNTSDQGPDLSYHSFDEHEAILTALETRDGSTARVAMRTHLESTLARMTTSPPEPIEDQKIA